MINKEGENQASLNRPVGGDFQEFLGFISRRYDSRLGCAQNNAVCFKTFAGYEYGQSETPITTQEIIDFAGTYNSSSPVNLASVFTITRAEMAAIKERGWDQTYWITESFAKAPELIQRSVILMAAVNGRAMDENKLTRCLYEGPKHELEVSNHQRDIGFNQLIIDQLQGPEVEAGQERPDFRRFLENIAGRDSRTQEEVAILLPCFTRALLEYKNCQPTPDFLFTEEHDLVNCAYWTDFSPATLAVAFTARDEEVEAFRRTCSSEAKLVDYARSAPERAQRAAVLLAASKDRAGALVRIVKSDLPGQRFPIALERTRAAFNQAIIDGLKGEL
jgi:hypothetical protein